MKTRGTAHWRVLSIPVAMALALSGCTGLTREEAAQALEEAALSFEANTLTGGSIEITTEFTIGGAVEQAAAELRTFVQTQLPCARVTLEGATLTIEYGALPGSCTYRGQTYAGTHTVSVLRNQMNDVVVSHTWTDLRNQRLRVTGSAMVTWTAADRTRRVSHDLTWTRISDSRIGRGTGERTQAALAGGLVEGFRESGELTWTGASGRWTLDVEDVQVRWVDPVPQAGRYVLGTPSGKTATLSFSRTGASTIRVSIGSGGRSFDFDVTSAGAVGI